MTGYPPELLDLDLDLEADLGVDTVKQAEVFAAVRARYGVERDENLKLRDFPTLNHVVGWITDKVAATQQPAVAPEPVLTPEPARAPAPVAGESRGHGRCRGVDRGGDDRLSAGAAGS